MCSIEDMHEEVGKGDRALEDISEIFYCGSPDASILVISEAPTTSKDDGVNTLHEIIQNNDEGENFRKDYPFDDTKYKRNTLYKVFVDNVLDFVEDKKEEIGFVDVSKKPLDDKDLEEINEENLDVLKRQIEYVSPEIAVCNKKNVSIMLDEYFGEENVMDYDNGEIKTSKEVSVGNEDMRLIFSSSIHVQMSKFSRKRVTKEIKRYHK